MNDELLWALDLIDSVNPILRTLLAGAAILLETSILIGLIIPGDTVVLIASTAVTGALEFVSMVVVVIAGSLIGESIGFALGHYFGPKFKSSRLGRRIRPEQWERATRYVDRRGGLAVFLSRFLPVFHSLVPLAVGMATMRYRRFIAWTIPACVLWSVAYVAAGTAAASGFRQAASRLQWAGVIFIGIILAFLLFVYLVKKLIVRLETRHMASSHHELREADRSEHHRR